MEYQQHSSGVAKAGLTTGIIGTALGVLNTAGGVGGLLGGHHGGGHGGYNPDYVHRKDRDREDENRRENDRRFVSREVADLQAENTRLKSERYTDERTSKLSHAVDMLQAENEMLRRDIKDVYKWAESTFVPQEKGYMDGRRVNYHGTYPLLGVDGGNDRNPINHNHGRRHSCEFAEG